MSHLFFLEASTITVPYYLGLSAGVSICVGFASQIQCHKYNIPVISGDFKNCK